MGNYILDYTGASKREIHAPNDGKAAGSVVVSQGEKSALCTETPQSRKLATLRVPCSQACNSPRKMGVWAELTARPTPQDFHLLSENERMAEVEWRREVQLIREAESGSCAGVPFRWASVLVVRDQKKPMQQARELQVPQKLRKANA